MSFADDFREAVRAAQQPRALVRIIETELCHQCGVYKQRGVHCSCTRLLTEGTPLTENMWPIELGGEG